MENDDDIKEIELENKKEKISQKNITKKNEDNNESSTNNIYKDKIFVYTDANKKKYLYIFHRQSNDKEYNDLRCKDRNCSGRAKYNIKAEIITISQNCSLEKYEDHNYIKEEVIREKIKKMK